jgi:hypothetical protein
VTIISRSAPSSADLAAPERLGSAETHRLVLGDAVVGFGRSSIGHPGIDGAPGLVGPALLAGSEQQHGARGASDPRGSHAAPSSGEGLSSRIVMPPSEPEFARRGKRFFTVRG